VILLLFWDCDGLLLEHYFEQGTTVTATSCTEILKSRLKPEICNKHRGVLSKEFLLLHNNIHLHSSAATTEVIRQLKFEFLSHPPIESRPSSIGLSDVWTTTRSLVWAKICQ